MLEEKGFQQSRWPSERRTFEQANRLRKIKQATLGRKIEHAQRAGDAKALPLRRADAAALVDKQQIGV
jgi:hypothetical protein